MAKKRGHENGDVAAMIGRMIRALGRRCEYADVEDLQALLGLQNVLDETIRSTIEALRDEQGFSWRWVAEATGTTRQAAQQRYGRRQADVASAPRTRQAG